MNGSAQEDWNPSEVKNCDQFLLGVFLLGGAAAALIVLVSITI
jgi:hypothetical protein